MVCIETLYVCVVNVNAVGLVSNACKLLYGVCNSMDSCSLYRYLGFFPGKLFNFCLPIKSKWTNDLTII